MASSNTESRFGAALPLPLLEVELSALTALHRFCWTCADERDIDPQRCDTASCVLWKYWLPGASCDLLTTLSVEVS